MSDIDQLRKENSAMRKTIYNQRRQIKALCKTILNIRTHSIRHDEIEIHRQVANRLKELTQ